jgi:hypothetical protein
MGLTRGAPKLMFILLRFFSQQPQAHIYRSRTGKPAGFFQSGGLFRPELATLRGLSRWERPKDLPIQRFGSVPSASLALEAGQVCPVPVAFVGAQNT